MKKAVYKTSIAGWVCMMVLVSACTQEIDQQTAQQMAIHRNLGLAYIEESNYKSAIDEFKKLVNIAPGEPLGYANIGLAYLNMNNLVYAEKWFVQALDLAPDNPGFSLLLTRVYDLTDRHKRAVTLLHNVLQENPSHIKTLYKLSRYYTESEESSLLQKAEAYLMRVVHLSPANVVARIHLIEVLLKVAKPGEALQQLELFRQILPEFPEQSIEVFNTCIEFARSGDSQKAFTSIVIFHNFLKSTSLYQSGLQTLQGEPGLLSGEPVKQFISKMPEPLKKASGLPAVNFEEQAMPELTGMIIDDLTKESEISENIPATILAAGDFDGDDDADLLVSGWSAKDKSSRQFLFINDNGQFNTYKKDTGLSHTGRDICAVFADYDNDGYLDIYFTNTTQDRLYHNNNDGTFSDVTSASGLGIVSNGNAAVFVDLDLEGDLDLFIASSTHNRLFRNNLDGTFTEITTQSGFPEKGENADSRDACFADFDDDGDMDLFIANHNSGDQLFDNLRQSNFHDKSETGFDFNMASQAVTSADFNNDGSPDMFVTDWNGQNHALYQNTGNGTFKKDNNSEKAFASLEGVAGYSAEFFDMDNDGYLDLLFSGTAGDQSAATNGLKLFHNDGSGRFLDASSLLPDVPTGVLQSVIHDFDSDGDLDVIYAGTDKSLHFLKNKGGNSNNYHSVQLRGLRTASGKNNYFGIGARIEVKSGSLYQMQVMDQPVAHFGIGDARAADIIRIVWPNGTAQNWFEPQKDQTIVESQVLKGSCPYLYAWNGKGFEFATDVLWPSAIGMPLGIMGKEKVYAFANSTDEYLKISGENIKPRNGKYLFQFASELWETPYLDKVKLLVVDHPQNSDIYINERFTAPPFDPFRIYSVRDKKIPYSASDENGSNILNEIAQQDGIYLANFKPAGFQGIMAMHDIILDLGDLHRADSIFLFMNGWLFPTDASINVNLSQTAGVQTISPCLQVKDKRGKWKTVIENMGFPKGKNKTMIFDLTDVFVTDDYRIRIRTNMQIYWDHIFYATNVNRTKIRVSNLAPVEADLQFRGFSEVARETPYSPHIPDYNKVSTETRWRDLTGFYTRYGDVLPLLMESDNKYAIMNAGDAITLQFDMDQVDNLAEGWKRDFIFYNDGWLKDGDLNTAHGQTVEPLPFHGMTRYPYGDEQSYPATKEYQDYQSEYNTREVSTEPFKKWLLNKSLGKK